MKYICTLICMGILTLSHAQTKKEGFSIGLNVGAYFANVNEAMYYNGADSRPAKLRNVLGNQSTYEEVALYLNDDFVFNPNTTIFRYKPGIEIGFHLQYYTSSRLAFYSNFDIALLDSYGIFLLELTSPPQPPKTTNTQEGVITASEKRFTISGGFHILLLEQQKYTPYIDLGAIASFLQTNSHSMTIGPITRSMYYSADSYVNETALYSTFGYGPQFGAGVQFPLSEKYYVYLGAYADFIRYGFIENKFALNTKVRMQIQF